MGRSSWYNRDGHPLLFAHRGASLELPENSLPAFERALQCGADVLEMDVHMTADRVVVVSHDASGLRMAGVDRLIAACRYAEVASWDIGTGFVDGQRQRPFAGSGYRMPTFEQVLHRFPEALLNVDIKQSTPEMARAMVALIERHDAQNRVLLTSFTYSTLRMLRKIGYGGPLGLSRLQVARIVLLPTILSRLCGVPGVRVQIPLRAGFIDLSTKRVIDKMHKLGLFVDYWVVDDVSRARQLLERGADGIVTNDPATMSQMVN